MAGPLFLRTSSTIQVILAQSTHPYEPTAFSFDDTYGIHLVSRTIAEPIDVRCSKCGKLYSFKATPLTWKVEVDYKATPSDEEITSLGINAKYVRFCGISITPPPIVDSAKPTADVGSSEHIHTISTKVEIQAVLTHLQKRLGSLQLGSDHWLFSSENCRIITSVSNPDGSSFPLSTAKKVAFVKTAWLRHFDSMSEPQCISEHALFNDHLGVHLDDWLMKIKRAPGFGSLTALLRGMKNAGVLDIESDFALCAGGKSHLAGDIGKHDLKQLLDMGKISSCESFRFRQQASTLEPKQILAWQDVCEKIVLRAHGAEGTYFAWQFSSEGEYRAPSFGVRSMLRELGVKNSTIRFFEKRHAKSAPDADVQLAQALNSVMNVLGPLALHKANFTLGTARATDVRERVLAKMKGGAYSRMHEKYIQACTGGR